MTWTVPDDGAGRPRVGSVTDDASIRIQLGHDVLVLRKRYEVLSIVNDILVAVWFLVGSILFFHESTTYAGTWLFVLGSVELLIRPVIRLVRHVHISRVAGADTMTGVDSAQDF